MSTGVVQSEKCGSSPMKILPFIAKLLTTSKRFSKLVGVKIGKPCSTHKLSLFPMKPFLLKPSCKSGDSKGV
uniref:Uncharacterized protein n=1 Tax=Arundo donax TaxID=35708 RepID=A0A0A9E5M9_ARUDO